MDQDTAEKLIAAVAWWRKYRKLPTSVDGEYLNQKQESSSYIAFSVSNYKLEAYIKEPEFYANVGSETNILVFRQVSSTEIREATDKKTSQTYTLKTESSYVKLNSKTIYVQ